MVFTPSPQQAAFLGWVKTGRGSAILQAVAGAGKTTTILEALSLTGGGAAIMAYNKKIATEIKEKIEGRGISWKDAQAGTCHSFGFGAYRKAFPGVTVDGNKVRDLIDAAIHAETDGSVYRTWKDAIGQMVGLAKQRALGIIGSVDNEDAWHGIIDHFDLLGDPPEEAVLPPPTRKLIHFAMKVLQESNARTDTIDFDDMVYLPVLHRVRFWRYRWIFLDEAQDTNPARRALVRAMLAPGGRLVAVGDPRQAIYGFTGADADSLDLIRRDFGAIEMPLTVSYRCPTTVVGFARTWVDHIQAHPSAPAGSVSSIAYEDLFARPDLKAGSAILCRNTRPLVALAFALIRRKIAAKVEGREIGNGLIAIVTRWKRIKTLPPLETKLTEWSEKQIARATARGNGELAQQVEDQLETIKVFIDGCREAGQDTVAALADSIQSLFGDEVTETLVLSTIHKSKGREWEAVFWLDREHTCPSKWARQAWEQGQEDNLCYVAATRAKTHLIEITKPAEKKPDQKEKATTKDTTTAAKKEG